MGLTPVVICLTTLGDGQVRHVHVCVNACGCMGACKLEREREQVGAVRGGWSWKLEMETNLTSFTPVAELEDAVKTFQL